MNTGRVTWIQGVFMRTIIGSLVMLFVVGTFAQEATITTASGKTIKAKIAKIEAEKYNGTGRAPANEFAVVQGNSEYLLSFDKISSLKLLETDDMSCYEDSAYKPTREFCSKKLVYEVKLKIPDKNKQKIEIVDERKFIFTLAGQPDPIVTFFYKIQASDEGKEAETNLKQIENMVKDFQQNGIKSIKF